jgi:hypothetical protein
MVVKAPGFVKRERRPGARRVRPRGRLALACRGHPARDSRTLAPSTRKNKGRMPSPRACATASDPRGSLERSYTPRTGCMTGAPGIGLECWSTGTMGVRAGRNGPKLALFRTAGSAELGLFCTFRPPGPGLLASRAELGLFDAAVFQPTTDYRPPATALCLCFAEVYRLYDSP